MSAGAGGVSAVLVAHVRDLLFSSRIAETARRLGYPCRIARWVDDLRPARRGARADLLDLTALAGSMRTPLSGRSRRRGVRRPCSAGRPTCSGRRPSRSTAGAIAW